MACQADFSVDAMCRVLGVSTSGFYAWRERPASARCQANQDLTQRIRAFHEASDKPYGMPRIRADLQDAGIVASRKRVARLMQQAQLRGVSRRRGFVVTTERNPAQRPAPDLVDRKFVANGPNQLWVADMTFVPT